MRDKKRIKTIMKKLQQCWEFTPEVTFYELIFYLYHDNPEQWTDYYKEDEYWIANMEDYKLAHIANNTSTNISELQKKILNDVEAIWENYYDLRFPQICNLLYSIIGENIDDIDVENILQKKVGELDEG